MKFRGGEFSTGTMGNFQPELTAIPSVPEAQSLRALSASRSHSSSAPDGPAPLQELSIFLQSNRNPW